MTINEMQKLEVEWRERICKNPGKKIETMGAQAYLQDSETGALIPVLYGLLISLKDGGFVFHVGVAKDGWLDFRTVAFIDHSGNLREKIVKGLVWESDREFARLEENL